MTDDAVWVDASMVEELRQRVRSGLMLAEERQGFEMMIAGLERAFANPHTHSVFVTGDTGDVVATIRLVR